MKDWKKEIGLAFLVKQKLFEVDIEGLWPFHYPEVAATEAEIVEVERKVRCKLDSQYREFLKFANGWKACYQCVDLFGTKDYQGSKELVRADQLLVSVEPLEELCGIKREECLPIAVSTDSIDVFIVASKDSKDPGAVFWFAGQLIERYNNFGEFFLATVDLNRYGIESLQKD